MTGLPLAWQVETARNHESLFVAPLLDAARGFQPRDGRDGHGLRPQPHLRECDERGCAAIVALRKNQRERTVRIPRDSDQWRNLYRRRSAVEREFGYLKHHLGLAALRVRGIERVRLHADLIMLARLASAQIRTRAEPLAA